MTCDVDRTPSELVSEYATDRVLTATRTCRKLTFRLVHNLWNSHSGASLTIKPAQNIGQTTGVNAQVIPQSFGYELKPVPFKLTHDRLSLLGERRSVKGGRKDNRVLAPIRGAQRITNIDIFPTDISAPRVKALRKRVSRKEVR